MYTKEMQVGKKKRRKKHKPSIIQKKDGRCYLCMLLDEDNGVKKTQEHHIFGGPNRDHSEETGLVQHGGNAGVHISSTEWLWMVVCVRRAMRDQGILYITRKC